MNIDELRVKSIAYCVEQNTVAGLAEAIAICISNLRDKDGKYLCIRLSDDYQEHMDFCVKIAEQLRKAQEK
jgi:hypothetical protein